MLWAQSTTKDYIRAEHKLQFISKLFIPQVSYHNPNSIHNFGRQNQKNNNTCFGAYLYSASTQHGNLHPARWPILSCGPTQEPVLATANTGKICERFWKNAGEWTGRVENSKGEIPASKCSMYGNMPTYSRLPRENLWALCSHQMGL